MGKYSIHDWIRAAICLARYVLSFYFLMVCIFIFIIIFSLWRNEWVVDDEFVIQGGFLAEGWFDGFSSTDSASIKSVGRYWLKVLIFFLPCFICVILAGEFFSLARPFLIVFPSVLLVIEVCFSFLSENLVFDGIWFSWGRIGGTFLAYGTILFLLSLRWGQKTDPRAIGGVT